MLGNLCPIEKNDITKTDLEYKYNFNIWILALFLLCFILIIIICVIIRNYLSKYLDKWFVKALRIIIIEMIILITFNMIV